MADLHQPRPLAFADVGDTAGQQLEVGPRLQPGVVRARGDDRQPAALHDLGVAAHRGGQHRGPALSAAARISAAAAGEIVVESTIRPGGHAGTREQAIGPVTTSSTSAEPATIVNTMSRSARSAGESTTVAPSSASDSPFPGCGCRRRRRDRPRAAAWPGPGPCGRRRSSQAAPLAPCSVSTVQLPHRALCNRLQQCIRRLEGRQARRVSFCKRCAGSSTISASQTRAQSARAKGGDGTAQLRRHGGGLGGAGSLRPAA